MTTFGMTKTPQKPCHLIADKLNNLLSHCLLLKVHANFFQSIKSFKIGIYYVYFLNIAIESKIETLHTKFGTYCQN